MENKIKLLILLVFSSFSAVADDSISGLNLEDFEKKKNEQTKWQNNPFVQTVDDVDVYDLQLKAIIWSPSDAAALINGEIVKTGEKIGISHVVSIEKDRVILRNENGIFRLPLKGAAQ